MAPKYGPIITIVGPTASGKSALAMELARQYSAVILCADSRTIYREMNIGTAKPSDEDRQEIEHFGLDLINPNERFSAYDFLRYAQSILAAEAKHRRPVIVVGGSGMYIDSLLFNYKFRMHEKKSEAAYAAASDDEVAELIARLYPELTNKIDAKNIRRMRQLLEKGPSNSDDRTTLKLDTIILSKTQENHQLKQNISNRTQSMLKQGFVQEVESIRSAYGVNCTGLTVTGYRRVNEYLDGKYDLEEMERLINHDTRQLARKQMTWFRRNPYIYWSSEDSVLISRVADYMNRSSVK